VTATNMSWNGRVEPGKSVYIGFNASGTGSDPTAFTVNGKACKNG
jgi:endoglucanase